MVNQNDIVSAPFRTVGDRRRSAAAFVSFLRRMSAALIATVTTALWAQTAGPAPVSIVRAAGAVADGYLFYTQQRGTAAGNGPVMMDSAGRPVWFLPLSSGVAADFRVQTYRGQPVLTWAQGASFQNATPGTGKNYICDTAYNIIATVEAGNGLNADLHEFELTPQGTALITIYHLVQRDLSTVGGTEDGWVLEGALQEIDAATGEVLFEWHSLDHVALEESIAGAPPAGTVFDYFHINSVKLDVDGNLLVSARHTSALYKLDRRTGAVIWRLGGKKSDFTLGEGFPFELQHNATAVDAMTIRLFDNGASGPSRVLWVKHDDAAMTATVVRAVEHPDGLYAMAEGGAQGLPNGNTLVGWGTAGAISEFDAAGRLVFDLRLARGWSTYRAYRLPWVGRPATAPTAAVYRHEDGTFTAHAIWNGATEVASWQILGSDETGAVGELARVAWDGLDTEVALSAEPTSVRVAALDRNGAVLGTSAMVQGPFPLALPDINDQPQARTIAAGSSVVLSVSATDATSYRWRRNGVAVVDGPWGAATVQGANTPVLRVSGVTAANAGWYSCVIANESGSVTSTLALVTAANTEDIGRLINVSCRAYVSGGERALITGFVVGGEGASGAQNVMVAAAGPALAIYGVDPVLPDPRLALYGDDGLARAASGGGVGWRHVAAATKAVENAAPSAGRDVEMTETLPCAAYTAVVSSPTGASGVVLTEIENVDLTETYVRAKPRLINGSGRAEVGAGAKVLVAGFVIGGRTSRTVLIRAAGPALAAYGVKDALPDPQLRLYAASGELLASNGDWAGDPRVATVANEVGAFPWPDAAAKDAALLITLPPGAYTAQVSDEGEATGVALVEVYDAD